MTWRASHYVAAGALAAGMLVWAAHEAWPSREIPIALPIVVTSAYDEWADALGAAIPDSFLPPGQRVALAWKIAEVFDWEVDFTKDIRPGDRVEVLIERLQSPEGEKRFSRILAARVDVARAPTFAFAFELPDGQTGFYDEKGRSLRRAFLRAPLRFSHISSRFGGRFHPIL